MKAEPIIGAAAGREIAIDLTRLIESRMIVQANSGAGKSWALRRILEQTHGRIQHLVIDVEDEFHTLREKFDYVLAGRHGGDCPADVRSAPLLARRLLELGVSAIIGIYELEHYARIQFVKHFLHSLVNAPRELWRPVLVVVDEAHIFCPEKGHAESSAAVVDLMTRGRKRGFCGILATQRISKLDKNAAAEANNKLIGRSSLDVDMKRAADELGFTNRESQAGLRTLKPGEFYAFGPAISDTVTLLNVGPVQTSHPKAGQRSAPPPPPREQVRAVLAKLADLPQEAEAEIQTAEGLRDRIRTLEAEYRQARAAQPAIDPKAIEAAELRGYARATQDLTVRVGAALNHTRSIEDGFRDVQRELKDMASLCNAPAVPAPSANFVLPMKPAEKTAPPALPFEGSRILGERYRETSSNGTVSKAGRKILTALAQFGPSPDTKVGAVTGYAAGAGHFGNALSELRSKELIAGQRDRLQITDAGLHALGQFDRLPTGPALQEYWYAKLSKGAAEILRQLVKAYPRYLTDQEIGQATGYTPNAGHFGNCLSELRTRDLITGTRNGLKASQDLFS